MAIPLAPPKTSWADDVDDLDQPKNEETVDANGIITQIIYTTNEEGKKVKITRRIKRTLVKATVDPVVAQRKTWAKFGAEKGAKPGPDRATTTVAENVVLKLMAGSKAEPEPEQEDSLKKQLDGKKIQCRLCKGPHFTTKCPYRDTLGSLGVTDTPEDGIATPQNEPAAPAPSGSSGKYVPPSMRAGANRAGETMGRSSNRDDLPTLRVTNVSEDAYEDDLRDLFSKFGRVARVYIGKDRETGIGKGYAFVSFEDRAAAERALAKTDGLGYDNLILNVQWSQPREQRGG
ncbi:translation initiation factor eIF3 subunit g [Tulasnella sp. 419]|nr:translation initiation factor eIF3 subunit g [Tulasnella sp. 418]KAG8965528.1 translation initiation factor eIF3 subunit g [Tulasnella sp. 419]